MQPPRTKMRTPAAEMRPHFVSFRPGLCRRWLLAVCAALLLASCTAERHVDGRPRLAVSVAPVRHLLTCLSDTLFQVDVLLPAGASPETFEPTAAQMLAMADCRALVRFGTLGFERSLLTQLHAAAPDVPLYDLCTAADALDDDPHVWTSPRSMKQLAVRAAEVLSDVDPLHAPLFRQRLDAFCLHMDSLDAALSARLAPVEGTAFVIHHPSLAVFARDYRLHQISIEQEGKEVSARALLRIEQAARDAGVRLVFVTPGHPADLARQLAARIGARVVEINPLSEDYDHFLQTLADALAD